MNPQLLWIPWNFSRSKIPWKLTLFFNCFLNQASDFADDPPPREKKARTAAAPKAKNGYLSSDDEFDAMVKKETPEKKNGAGNGNANSDSDSEFGAPPPAKKANNGNGKKKTNLYILFSSKVKHTGFLSCFVTSMHQSCFPQFFRNFFLLSFSRLNKVCKQDIYILTRINRIVDQKEF